MSKHRADLYSLAVATTCFLVLLISHSNIIYWISGDLVDLSNLYSAVFGWSSIQTGFLFAVYGFISGKGNDFLKAVARTKAMEKYNTSLGSAIFVGFALTITSMPLLVIPLEPAVFNIWYVIIAAWFSLFVWAFLLFCNVAYTFGVIATVKENTDIPAR